jgi:hypothetical protein
MAARASIVAAMMLSAVASVQAQVELHSIEPYPLPADALRATADLAAESDVLVLGEIHGTQEVPAIAAALLAPLTRLGYRVLAIEVPADQQEVLTAWATNKTAIVPAFFARPWKDGRGSVEALKLIRVALSPPYSWKLICFDVTASDMTTGLEENRRANSESDGKHELNWDLDQVIAISKFRDATMAINFAHQRQQVAPHSKVLAICGNLHARTARSTTSKTEWSQFWPSFAAALQGDHPSWRVRSLNIRPQQGGYFNGGNVNTFKGTPRDDVLLRLTPDAEWNANLDLPLATPATFLAIPNNAAWLPTATGSAQAGGGSNLERPAMRRRGRCHCTRR